MPRKNATSPQQRAHTPALVWRPERTSCLALLPSLPERERDKPYLLLSCALSLWLSLSRCFSTHAQRYATTTARIMAWHQLFAGSTCAQGASTLDPRKGGAPVTPTLPSYLPMHPPAVPGPASLEAHFSRVSPLRPLSKYPILSSPHVFGGPPARAGAQGDGRRGACVGCPRTPSGRGMRADCMWLRARAPNMASGAPVRPRLLGFE
jgi:hypothetical protein